MKYSEAVCKKCRRFNEKLFLKGDKCLTNCIIDRRKSSIRQKKLSDYGKHLREKQILRDSYLMSEAQFRRYFSIASKAKGRTGETMLKLIELRLDNIVRRIGYASSIRTARQMVSHGHIKVNGRVIKVPSYIVKEGDEISLKKPEIIENVFIKKAMEDAEKNGSRPNYLVYNPETRSARLARVPERSELSSKINEQLIVEFYSK
jgi:small subunit ribosomal protein S4